MHRTPLSWKKVVGRAFGIACATIAAAENANATSVKIWENRRENPGAFRLIPELNFVSTKDNFDATGKAAPVTGLDSYSKTFFDLYGVYGLNARTTLYARLSLASVSYKTVSTSTTQQLDGSGFSMTEQAIGANYRMWESAPGRAEDGSSLRRTSIDVQMQVDLPLYDNVSLRSSNPPAPLPGDGTLDITIGPFLTHPLNQGKGSRLYLIGGLAYQIRNNNYSSALPYQLALAYLPPATGFFARGGFYGFKSMKSDGGTTQIAAGSAYKDAGGSLIVDALNSSYLAFRAWLGYQTKDYSQYYLGYATTMSGTSTAKTSSIVLGAQWRWGGTGARAASAGTAAATGGATAGEFVNYNLDGHVLQTNDRLNLVKIDKGELEGVEKGQAFDFFRAKADGSPSDRIARGVVLTTKGDQAVVQIKQYVKQVWIQPGFIARRLVK